MTVQVDNDELTRWEKRLLKVVKDVAPKEYRKTLRKAGNLLRKNVRRMTPKVEGKLRRSYRIKMRGKDAVLVYTNEFYAKMVEEGHAIVKYEHTKGSRGRVKRELGFVPGKFYFRKGYEQTEKELPAILKEFVRTIGKELDMDVSG